MTSCRALTLIEVLVSIVILSMLAGTCVPLMRDSMRSLRDPSITKGDIGELAAFADEVMARPTGFGVATWREVTELTLAWPQHPDRSPVSVSVGRAAGIEIDHGWVVFTCDGLTVSRWAHIEPEQAEAAQ